MEYEERLNLVCDLMHQDYKITSKVARQIISDFDIEDIVFHFYQDIIDLAEEKSYADYKYNEEHYADGWNEHIGG